jgi:hypothetical protein
MTSLPTIRHEPQRVALTEDGKRREAIAALEAVLATAEQRRPVLSPWECFHFRRGLTALLFGDYKRVWVEAEYALTPLAERASTAKAKVLAAGPLDPCHIAMLRLELAGAKPEPPKS